MIPAEKSSELLMICLFNDFIISYVDLIRKNYASNRFKLSFSELISARKGHIERHVYNVELFHLLFVSQRQRERKE